MNHHRRLSRSILISLLLPLLLFSCTFAEDDVRCLREVRNELTDPAGRLESWNFANISVGSICRFTGVTCWNDRENRLIGLELRDYSLTGGIPDALQFCHSLQTLDLSGNSLSGNIPEDLANCSYLNTLILDDNRLSGHIPLQFSSLGRFSIANNDLSGTVPSFNGDSVVVDYGGNSGLCGGSLGRCGGRSLAIIIAAGVLVRPRRCC
ncbi:probable inactive receptor kinase at1g27190 [Phtheirospermum japonicum]|uniref:Probable inactive receptor kinase at1g27190 n=1 Tax=Phtheirospermum japonicum TaxID=374723 RepID=A0A830CTT8_9LAMI|nr:probable inactive receptor kinase at1g27190 [Phtheirospermum japonicum]